MKIGEFDIIDPIPELNDPIAIAMLRPWVDVGRVGTITLTKLEQYLGAKELGRLSKPGMFFDFTRYRPRTRVIGGRRVLRMPNSIVHYAHDERSDQDYLFLHLREPHNMGEDYSSAIVDLLNHFNVKQYCRIGGMYDSVPHTRPLLVTGTLPDDQQERAKGLISPRRGGTYQGPTSIVNLVGDTLVENETPTTSLMVHLPQYVQLDEDHFGASRLTEVLCAIYGFPMSLADNKRGQQQYRDISRAVTNNSEVTSLIEQLETYYDRILSGQASSSETQEGAEGESQEEDINLAPGVEQFLREMGSRLTEEEQQGSDDVDDEDDQRDE